MKKSIISNLQPARAGRWGGSLVSLTLAVVFLMMVNVRADLITGLGNVQAWSSVEQYMENARASSWTFDDIRFSSGGQSSLTWAFGMSDGAAAVGTGHLMLNGFNGNANINNSSGIIPTAANNLDSFGTSLLFSHNSANWAGIRFDYTAGQHIDSLFFDIGTHTNQSAREMTVWARYWNGTEFVEGNLLTNFGGVFRGFTFDDGAFLQEIRFIIDGQGNAGFSSAGIGTGLPPGFSPPPAAPVPAPATLAILRLGLAGLGLARRRMKKKK